MLGMQVVAGGAKIGGKCTDMFVSVSVREILFASMYCGMYAGTVSMKAIFVCKSACVAHAYGGRLVSTT